MPTASVVKSRGARWAKVSAKSLGWWGYFGGTCKDGCGCARPTAMGCVATCQSLVAEALGLQRRLRRRRSDVISEILGISGTLTTLGKTAACASAIIAVAIERNWRPCSPRRWSMPALATRSSASGTRRRRERARAQPCSRTQPLLEAALPAYRGHPGARGRD